MRKKELEEIINDMKKKQEAIITYLDIEFNRYEFNHKEFGDYEYIANCKYLSRQNSEINKLDIRQKDLEERLDKNSKSTHELINGFEKAILDAYTKKCEKLEQQYKELKDYLIGTNHLADKNGDYIAFLSTTDKDGVRVTEHQFTIDIEYIKNGTLHYISMDKKMYPDFKFDMVLKNEKDYAILSFKENKDNSLTYYKVDKNTEQVVDVTDLLPKQEELEKIGKAINSTIDNLSSKFASLFEQKSDNPKKTTKKKESK